MEQGMRATGRGGGGGGGGRGDTHMELRVSCEITEYDDFGEKLCI